MHAYGIYFGILSLIAGNFRQEKVASKGGTLVILCIVLTSSQMYDVETFASV